MSFDLVARDPRKNIGTKFFRDFNFTRPQDILFSFKIQHPDPTANMPPKKTVNRAATENISLGPQVREGELVFGVARIFASFNDTFVHVTDLTYVVAQLLEKSSKLTIFLVAAKPLPVSPVA